MDSESEPSLLKKVVRQTFNALSIHFSKSFNAPYLHSLSPHVDRLCGFTVSLDHYLKIYNINDSIFELTFTDEGNYIINFSKEMQGIPNLSRIRLIKSRVELFNATLDSYLKSHSTISAYSTTRLPVIPDPYTIDYTKKSNTKKRLRNDSEKFNFKERKVDTSNFGDCKMSVLDRIRLKEKSNKEMSSKMEEKMKHEHYVQSQMLKFYEILYQLSPKPSSKVSLKTFSAKQLISTIQDSISLPLSDSICLDVLIKLCDTLNQPDKLSIIEKNAIKVVKISLLDRDGDHRIISSHNSKHH
ncbi:BA75_00389T0 [Komagataella pastoris]|uniref:BA75_00389T0 n=1 Tax=Komagataella pastoris TaxID=4922 RepID=A0A1B2J7B6_PICPA|nr:BA75_00389T0 [Komagataella pastoris]